MCGRKGRPSVVLSADNQMQASRISSHTAAIVSISAGFRQSFRIADPNGMIWLQYFSKNVLNFGCCVAIQCIFAATSALQMSEKNWLILPLIVCLSKVCLVFPFCSVFALWLFPCTCCVSKYVFSLYIKNDTNLFCIRNSNADNNHLISLR